MEPIYNVSNRRAPPVPIRRISVYENMGGGRQLKLWSQCQREHAPITSWFQK